MQRSRVLIVEDERDIRESLCDLLADEGFVVVAVATLAAAAMRLAEQPFDCVVLDLQLPDGDADVLLGQLFERQDCPSVVLASAAERAAALAAKFEIAMLRKPFDVERLLAAVRVAVLRRHYDGPQPSPKRL